MSIQGFEFRAIENAGQKEAEVLIYDRIGQGFFEDGVTAKGFAQELKNLGDVKTIRVRINSPGGAVSEGTAIFNMLRDHKAKVIVDVDGMAASIASVIAMAGDEIRMAENALMMIHNPSGRASGNAGDMRKMADLLDKVTDVVSQTYATRTGNDLASVKEMMNAETWMTAAEAKEKNFINSVTGKLDTAAVFDVSDLSIPDRFADRFVNAAEKPQPVPEYKPMPETTVTTPQAASYEQIIAGCAGADAPFICAQLASKATATDAQAAWMKEQNARIEAAKKEAADAKLAAAKPGVVPLTNGTVKPVATDGETDPIVAWNDAVTANAKLFDGDKVKALKKTSRENPELHNSYIAAVNVGRKAS